MFTLRESLQRAAATTRRGINAFFIVIAAVSTLLLAPVAAHAAFSVSSFSFTPSAAQAGGHPNITFKLTRGGTNAEDLQNIRLTMPKGVHFNPEAAMFTRAGGGVTAKCLDSEFNTDTCPAATSVGTISASIRRDSGTGSSGTTSTVAGEIFALEASGNDDMVLGYVFRPSGWGAKAYVKQPIEVRTDNDTTVTGTNTINSLQTTTWTFPQQFGTTNITFLNFTFTYRARANSSTSTGPFFVRNPSDCASRTTTLTATSNGGVNSTPTAASYTTPTGCTNTAHIVAPALTTSVTNPSAGLTTGVTTTITQSMTDATIQSSTIKSFNQQLPLGTSFNTAGFTTLATCSEALLASDTCPSGSKVGTTSATYPFLPTSGVAGAPAWTGDIYLMTVNGTGNAATFAYVMRGPRGTRSIIRSSAGNSGSGSSARAFNNYTYISNMPWSSLTTSFTTPLIRNQTACPATGTVNTPVVGYNSTTAVNLTGTYSINCADAIPSTSITSQPASPTNDNTPTFGLSADVGSAQFEYSIDSASGPWSACPGTGTSSCTTSSIGDGSHTVYFRAFTASGPDATPASAPIAIDTVVPSVPTISSPVNGSYASTTPTYSGTAEPGATVRLIDGVNQVCLTNANGSGVWSCTTSALSQGAHAIYATATDAAGNASPASSTVTVNVDTVAPLAPVVSTPANGFVTNNGSVAVSGTAESGATVRVYDGAAEICSVTATGGAWSCGSPTFGVGSHALTARATDAANNTSGNSTVVNVTIDTTPPPAPSITAPANGSSTTDTTPDISGSAEAGATVRLYNGGGAQICSTTASGTGSWTCTSSALSTGNAHAIVARATDPAGNTGSNSSSLTIIVYPTTPETQLTSGPDGDAPDYPNGWPINTGTPSWSFNSPNTSNASFECQLDSTAGEWTACTSPLAWDQIETLNFDKDYDGTIEKPNENGDDETGEHRLYVRAVSGSNQDATPEVSHFNVQTFEPSFGAEFANPQSGANSDLAIDVDVPAGEVKSIAAKLPAGFWWNSQAMPIASRCSVAIATSNGNCPTGSKVGDLQLTFDLNPNPHRLGVPAHRVTVPATVFMAQDIDGTTGDTDPEIAWAVIVADVNDLSAYSWVPGGGNYGRVILRAQVIATDNGDGESVDNPGGVTLSLNDLPRTTTGASGAADIRLAAIDGAFDAENANYSAPLLVNPSSCDDAVSNSKMVSYASEVEASSSDTAVVSGCETTTFVPAISEFAVTPATPGPGYELHSNITLPAADSTIQSITFDLPPSIKQRDDGVQYQCDRYPLGPAVYGQTGVDPQPTCADATKAGSIAIVSPILPTPLNGTLYLEHTGSSLPNIYGVVQNAEFGFDLRLRAWTASTPEIHGGKPFIRARINAHSTGVDANIPSIPISSVSLDIVGSDSDATATGCNTDNEIDESGNYIYDDACPPGPGAILEIGTNCVTSDAAALTMESWSGKKAEFVSSELAVPDCYVTPIENDQAPEIKLISGINGIPEVLNGGPLSGSVTGSPTTTFTFEKRYRNNTVYSSMATKRQRVWFECSYDNRAWVLCDSAANANSVNLVSSSTNNSTSSDNVLNCGETTVLRGSFTVPAPTDNRIRKLAVRMRKVTGSYSSAPCNSGSATLIGLPEAIAESGNEIPGVDQRIWLYEPTAP